MAVEDGNGVLRLIDVSDGRTIARLEAPNQARASHFVFSPDGMRLIAAGNDDRAIRVWDLRAVRERLSELGLDWDAPSYPSIEANVAAPRRLQVTVHPASPPDAKGVKKK